MQVDQIASENYKIINIELLIIIIFFVTEEIAVTVKLLFKEILPFHLLASLDCFHQFKIQAMNDDVLHAIFHLTIITQDCR